MVRKKINDRVIKIYPNDLEVLRRISLERQYKRLDKKGLPPKRLIKAVLRIPGVTELLKSARMDNE